MEQQEKEFYTRLKEEIEKSVNKWPTEYLYKFIVPSLPENIQMMNKIFDGMGAVIDTKLSKSGTYTSFSISISMPNADAIIQKYQEVSVIKGIVSL